MYVDFGGRLKHVKFGEVILFLKFGRYSDLLIKKVYGGFLVVGKVAYGKTQNPLCRLSA